MEMLRQPLFGQRLRSLRIERGLSQGELAATGMSTGYLSRLESGERPPTARIIAYLTDRLGVSSAVFAESSAGSLANALAAATSANTDSAIEALEGAVADSAHGEHPALRWQALWQLTVLTARRGEHEKALGFAERLVEVSDDLAEPALTARARIQVARCCRNLGFIVPALESAQEAFAIARDRGLAVQDTVTALQTLVSCETEAGRLAEAREHSEQLRTLAEGAEDTLRAQALWTAATVRSRQGDHEGARELLDQAVALASSPTDLLLWMRLRLASASQLLHSEPPRTEAAAERLDEAELAVKLIGAQLYRQELALLKAHLAFQEGRHAEARELSDQIDEGTLQLSRSDEIRLGVLRNRLLIIEGHRDRGIANLRALAQAAEQSQQIDLAARVWCNLAEALAEIVVPDDVADGAP